MQVLSRSAVPIRSSVAAGPSGAIYVTGDRASLMASGERIMADRSRRATRRDASRATVHRQGELPMKRLAALCGALLLTLVTAAAASADDDRITRGDVEGFFNAALTGGTVIASRDGTAALVAPPANDPRVSPYVSGTYCSLDWHLVSVMVAWEDKAGLADVEVAFDITGVDTDDLRIGPIKPLVPRTDPPRWWRAYGLFYAPGVLPLGTHTLTTTATFPGEDPFTLPVQVEIVGPSHPVCQ
jgi:hypothetical protein